MTDTMPSRETREVHDPFLNKTVEVSNKLTDRLRGKYANGPTMPNGEPEFGWREFPVPPIQKEAADEIERLEARNAELAGALTEMDRFSLVITSAVRNADPLNHNSVVAVVKRARKALGIEDEPSEITVRRMRDEEWR